VRAHYAEATRYLQMSVILAAVTSFDDAPLAMLTGSLDCERHTSSPAMRREGFYLRPSHE
jgi:hypothetical protein